MIWLLLKDYLVFIVDLILMGFYLLLWGVFIIFMFIGIFIYNIIIKFVFGLLVLLFFLLVLGDFIVIRLIINIVGYVGILIGLFVMYFVVG